MAYFTKNLSWKVYPVGAKIRFLDVVLQVEKQESNRPSCAGCYFCKFHQSKRGTGMSCYTHGMACTPFIRKDKNHVIFKEQKSIKL